MASIALVLLSGLLALPVHAKPQGKGQGQEKAPRGPSSSQGNGISLDEAVDRAQRRYNARVIRAETRDDGGRSVHVLRLLSEDSRVWTVRVDASTGQFL